MFCKLNISPDKYIATLQTKHLHCEIISYCYRQKELTVYTKKTLKQSRVNYFCERFWDQNDGQWYLNFRPPSYSNNSVFDQKIQAKNASKFKQNFGVRTLELGTKKSRVESKCTSHSISQLNESCNQELKCTRQTGFLLKRRGRLLPSQIHLQRREREKTLKERYPASFRSFMLFKYTFS